MTGKRIVRGERPPSLGFVVRGGGAEAGFTRMELLVVCLCLATLMMMAHASGTKAMARSHGLACLANVRQLATALQLYAADNNQLLPGNIDNEVRGNWCGGNLASLSGATNSFALVDAATAPFGSYTKEARLYRCPDDPSTATISGRLYPRVRSYSMNSAVGTNPSVSGGKQPTDGAWLDGEHGHRAFQTWRSYGSFQQMLSPAPGSLYVFIEEDPFSINEGCFAGSMTAAEKMIDWPAQNHDGSASISFADGHVETHRWEDPRTRVVNGNVSLGVQLRNVDIQWLRARTSAALRPAP